MFLWGFGITADLQSLMLGIPGCMQLWLPLKCVIPNKGRPSASVKNCNTDWKMGKLLSLLEKQNLSGATDRQLE